MTTSSDANEAKARLAEATVQASAAITRKVIEWTDACTDALNAIAGEVNSAPSIPALDTVIAAAVGMNNAQPSAKLLVCVECYRVIHGPMVNTGVQGAAPRMVHYPECPTTEVPS